MKTDLVDSTCTQMKTGETLPVWKFRAVAGLHKLLRKSRTRLHKTTIRKLRLSKST